MQATRDLTQALYVAAVALGRTRDALDRVEAQLRRLSRELRSSVLDDLGLAAALDWLSQGVAERTGLAIGVEAPIGRLPSSVETALYRIIQEAFTNATRHAKARKVQIEVREDGPSGRWCATTGRDSMSPPPRPDAVTGA